MTPSLTQGPGTAPAAVIDGDECDHFATRRDYPDLLDSTPQLRMRRPTAAAHSPFFETSGMDAPTPAKKPRREKQVRGRLIYALF